MEVNGGLLRLNALIHGVGCGRTFQREAVTVVGKGLDHFRDDVGVEVLAVELAANVDANLIAGFGMTLGSFACQSGLRDLPEVDLLFGAERSLGGDGSAVGLGGDGIDLPGSGMEGWYRLNSLNRQNAERQQDENRGDGFCGSHGTGF